MLINKTSLNTCSAGRQVLARPRVFALPRYIVELGAGLERRIARHKSSAPRDVSRLSTVASSGIASLKMADDKEQLKQDVKKSGIFQQAKAYGGEWRRGWAFPPQATPELT